MASEDDVCQNACPKCNGRELQNEECASEEMLVCVNCGHIIEAGSIDMRRETVQMQPSTALSNSSSLASAFKTHGGSILGSMCRAAVFSELAPEKRAKLKSLGSHLERLADKMRLQIYQKQLCLEKIEEIVRLDNLQVWRPEEAVVAGIIYVFATDKTVHSLRRVKSYITYKKAIRKFVNMLKSLPSSAPEVISSVMKPPTSKRDVQTAFVNHLESLSICDDSEERKRCIDMCTALWELLINEKDLEHHLKHLNHSAMCSLIVVVLEHMRRDHNQKLEEEIAKKLDYQQITFNRMIGSVRGHLLKLSKHIPSLDECKVTMRSVVRFIPTIIQNKDFISSVYQTTENNRHVAQRVKQKKKTNPNSGEPCVPLEFNWPNDDSGSLELLDVDQYLATESEIEVKRKALEPD